jgi:capsule biosynthesis phosphatase
MIAKSNVLVVDVDGTLCPIKPKDLSYADLDPEPRILSKLRELNNQGWRIILHSSRGMRTYDGNTGEITIHVLPVLLEWLKRHDVPFDEVHIGKPWPGNNGFYVDDRAVRPREFLEYSFEEMEILCRRDRVADGKEDQ